MDPIIPNPVLSVLSASDISTKVNPSPSLHSQLKIILN